MLALAHPLLATMTLRQVARPAMKEIADYAGGSVSMGVRDRLNIVYVETSRSSSMFSRQLSDIGLSQPIAATAIGGAYLAACTPERREAILNEIRIKTPDIYERHHKKVMQSLGEFERLGFWHVMGRPAARRLRGRRAAAAPLDGRDRGVQLRACWRCW